MDGNKVLFKGKVDYVGDYDDFTGDYRYKIQEDGGGSRKNYNESSLRKSK